MMSKLIADAQAFFGALDADNSRAFWQAHKTRHDAVVKGPAMALLEGLTPHIAAMADCPVVPKLFRPHRDVRFSKDKTPYTTHVHMMWVLKAETRQNPVFFFGIGLDYVTAGAGIMDFDKAVLTDWRKWVDLDADRIKEIVAGLNARGCSLRPPVLKRVPPPFDNTHKAADLLRMKGLVASRTVTDETGLMDDFRALWPLNALLIQITGD